jgi:hypothetical protein
MKLNSGRCCGSCFHDYICIVICNCFHVLFLSNSRCFRDKQQSFDVVHRVDIVVDDDRLVVDDRFAGTADSTEA